MKVLFDNQQFTTDATGGVVRIYAELMRHYDAMPDVEYDMPITYTNNLYLKELPRFQHIKPLRTYDWFLPGLHFRGKGRLYRLWCRFGSGRVNHTQVAGALRKGDYDVFHPTYYDSGWLKHLGGKPFVLMVYDMIHELIYAKDNPLDPTARNKKKLVKHATRIIAISESAKQDLIKILDVPPEKIDVVYLGNSMKPLSDGGARPAIDVPKRYLLYVGMRLFYKNFLFFVKSIAPLLREDADLHLVCVGSMAFSMAEIDLFQKEKIMHKILYRKASEAELAEYYTKAQVFIYPSLYEGFGMPVLEAFACGCPAIISNTSCFPEVGGEAAAYFDPHSEVSIYQTIKDVLASPERRAEMIKAGREQLKKFSWQKTAEETVKVYERALRDHRAEKQASS